MDDVGRKDGCIAEVCQLDDSQIVGTMHTALDEKLVVERNQQTVQVAGDIVCYSGVLVLYMECFRAHSEVKGMSSLRVEAIRLEQTVERCPCLLLWPGFPQALQFLCCLMADVEGGMSAVELMLAELSCDDEKVPTTVSNELPNSSTQSLRHLVSLYRSSHVDNLPA